MHNLDPDEMGTEFSRTRGKAMYVAAGKLRAALSMPAWEQGLQRLLLGFGYFLVLAMTSRSMASMLSRLS
jgi:hypothetical protein